MMNWKRFAKEALPWLAVMIVLLVMGALLSGCVRLEGNQSVNVTLWDVVAVLMVLSIIVAGVMIGVAISRDGKLSRVRRFFLGGTGLTIWVLALVLVLLSGCWFFVADKAAHVTGMVIEREAKEGEE